LGHNGAPRRGFALEALPGRLPAMPAFPAINLPLDSLYKFTQP